jgi:pentatricopeptide repeat protein
MHLSIIIVGEEDWLENEEDTDALVDMYARCDALADAQKLFDMRSNHTKEAWNVMIAGYVRHGLPENARACFDRMRCCASLPDSATFCRVLEACSAESSVTAADKGKERHVEIRLGGYCLKTDLAIGNALLEMYAIRRRDPPEVQRVFDELVVRDEASWNRLMLSCRSPRGQLACFARMKLESSLPSSTASACALNACGGLRASRDGERIHAQQIHLLEEPDNVVIGNSLVDMYGKCGALAKALKAFDALPRKNAISWTALISAYVEHVACGKEALACFRRMLQEGIPPDAVTYVSILKACGGIRALNDGKEMHAKIAAARIEQRADAQLGNALLRMYSECGSLPEAEQAFRELPIRDAVSWGLLISAYARFHGCAIATLACFGEMEIEDGDLALDSTAYVHVLKACGSIGAIEKGTEVHKKLQTRHANLHDPLGNALVDMYAKCGEPGKAHEAFDNLTFRDIASWTALMAGYAQIGRLDAVADLLERMVGEGIDLDAVLFTVLLNACSDSGLLDEGELCFGTMVGSYGIAPTKEHCTCMVDLFSRAGQLGKALVVAEEMPSLDHLPAWATLLGACAKWGDEKLGELAFQHLVELDRDNALIYICMMNIYAVP